MTSRKSGLITRRSLLKTTAAAGAAASVGGVNLFNVNRAFADMMNPADVLAKINVANYVNKDYQKQYGLNGDELMWDPNKDWIRTADWEAIRKEHAGKTVRFLISSDDRESALAGTQPFKDLSGINIDLVAIPDGDMKNKIVSEAMSGNPSFDCMQYFSPWLGDFAAQGLLAKLDDYATKWKLPLDDFYDTYRLNYAQFGDKGMFGIPFDCDIQQVHIRKSIFKQVLGKDPDTITTIPSYEEMIRLAPELAKVEKGVSAIGMMAGRGFWATYLWEHVAAQHGMMLFDDKWEPTLNSEAGIKGLETILALSKNAIEGVAAADWPTNRGAFLGGQIACNISWQDSGTQATRPDQSKLGDDILTIYEPRVAGGVYCPPNIAGSTSSVAATSPEPEAAPPAAVVPDDIVDHGRCERSQRQRRGPGYRSVLNNENSAQGLAAGQDLVGSAGLRPCSPRLPSAFDMSRKSASRSTIASSARSSRRKPRQRQCQGQGNFMGKSGFYAGKDPVSYASMAPGLNLAPARSRPSDQKSTSRGKPRPFLSCLRQTQS
ncbi:MAG: extracellular solute-binding protein [Hyphomicrobiales bacterium]